MATATARVTWTAPLDGGPVISYNLERRIGGGAWTPRATIQAPTLTYDDTTADDAQVCEYRIASVNASGISPFSVVGSINAPPPLPGVPGTPVVAFL